MKKVSEYNGIVVIDKPAGMTSHDVVNRARRLYHTKRVGHTGTLDPDATGVLVLCLGYATRLAEYLSGERKNYIAEAVFGIETDTEDASGRVLATKDASALTESRVLEICAQFQGKILQTPPMVSSLHHGGKRLYELAREGITVERQAREIVLYRNVLLGFTPGTHPVAQIEVSCSSGTYIRTLTADMGAAAGFGGMMRSLRRTWVGDPAAPIALQDAYTLEALQERAEADRLAETVLPAERALRGWNRLYLEPEPLLRLRHGQKVEAPPRTNPDASELAAILLPDGEVCAIARYIEDHLQPIKVLIPLAE